jgi:integrase
VATHRKRKANRAAWGKVRKLPSGNYQASYVGPNGNRFNAPMTYLAKVDADAWLAVQRAEIAAGRWTPTTPTADADAQAERARNLSDYARIWIDTRTGRDGAVLRPTTRVEYDRLLAGPLGPLAHVPLAAMTPAKVRAWYSELVGTGRKTTAARAYGLLRSVMQTAVLDGLLTVNPCSIRGAQNASTGRKVEPPTMAELAIIEATMPDHLRAAVGIAAWGALRYGELTELRRRDVLQDGDTVLIRVERAVTRVPGMGFHVGPPKSAAGVRVITMPPQVSRVILNHLDYYAAPGEGGLLFPARNGGHLAESTFIRSWYPARAAAGREDMPWHALRHFGLTRYAQTGATLAEIQARAGHSTHIAAMRYQHTAGRDAELTARMVEL